MGVDHADGRVAALAGRQGGAITYAQLRALGVGRGAIEHRVLTGSLHRRHRGVYVVGHLAKAPLVEEFAAVLACPDGSLVSHHAAAALHGLRAPVVPPIDVTVRRGDPRRHPGIRIHAVSTRLDATDHRVRAGLPMTAPARTLLDLAAVLTARDLRWAGEEARVLRLVAERDLRSVMERHPRQRGVGRLRAAVGFTGNEPRMTRSEAERRLVWRTERLVVEVDGYAFHSGRTAFERDRRRDAVLQSAGLRVTRLSWRQITEEPLAVAVLLTRLLDVGA